MGFIKEGDILLGSNGKRYKLVRSKDKCHDCVFFDKHNRHPMLYCELEDASILYKLFVKELEKRNIDPFNISCCYDLIGPNTFGEHFIEIGDSNLDVWKNILSRE